MFWVKLTENVTLLLLRYMYVCFLTKLVTNSDGLRWVRWLADTSRVAASDAEAIGFPLGEIEQCKARRLDWDLCVHPLPAVCARNTLTNKDTRLVWIFPYTGNM